MTDKEIQINIERYIKGMLSQNETDQLWTEFLKNPGWYDYLNTYLNIINLAKKG